jgi:hypothetical protein
MFQDLKDLITIALGQGRTDIIAYVPDDDGYGTPAAHRIVAAYERSARTWTATGYGRVRAYCEISSLRIDGVILYTNTEAI